MAQLMSMKQGSSLHFNPGSWQETAHDIYIGMVVGTGHIVNIFVLKPYNFVFGTVKEISLLPQAEGELRVVGVGFGRTGTYSLKLALDQLGYPTLHTQHLYEDENEQIFHQWTDKIFKPSMYQGQAVLGEADFDIVVRHGYQGTMDFPFALYYEKIMEDYPDCKFILTTRDSSEVWFRSWDTLTKSISTPANIGGIFLSGVQRYSIYLRWLFAVVNQDNSYLTATTPQVNQYKDSAIESYESHNARVREMIPAHRLLEYSVKQGWQPLCDFLAIEECPTTPFPKTNSARSVQVQSISATALPVVIVLLVAFMFVGRRMQRGVGKSALRQVTSFPARLRSRAMGEAHFPKPSASRNAVWKRAAGK